MDLAEKTLEPDDEVQDIFNASHNDQNGYVMLSQKKLLFVSEKGFFRKIYDLVLEVPYDEVDEVRCIGNVLTLLVEEKRHIFKTGFAEAIEKSIKDLKESTIIA